MTPHIEGVYPDRPLSEAGEPEGPRGTADGGRDVIWAGSPGIVQAIDVPRIIGAARDADVAVEIVVSIGETVQQQTPVAVIHGAADPSLDAVVLKAPRSAACARSRSTSAACTTPSMGACRR